MSKNKMEQYGFNDTDIEHARVTGNGNVELFIRRDTEFVVLYVDDIIALAKQAGITSKHLE